MIKACEAIRTGSGEPIKLIGTTQDIHERKMMEEALRESQRRYQKAEKVGNFGHWARDLMTDKVFWSPQVYNIFGVAPDDFEPLWVNFLERIHPGDDTTLPYSSRMAFTLKQNEEAHIAHTMATTQGNRSEAAKILGISLRHLHRKLAAMKKSGQWEDLFQKPDQRP